MSDLTVRIVELPPLRVASFHGFGPHPEQLAAQKLAAWAAQRGYLADPAQHRIFGFNNPNPSAGSPNYGYEFWIVVGPEVETTAEAPVLEFGGGLYAVTRCQGVENIGPTWGRLVQWLTGSRYGHAEHQWLEENLNPGFVAADEDMLLDLYAPITA
jgi:DNA gyrase inhibitor GyrI